MAGILDRAKEHYQHLDRRRIEVPEWGEAGHPAVVTWTALTVAERRKIYRADGAGKAPDGATIMVRAVIEKACDAGGKKLFDAMAEHDLTYSVASDVVGRIANAILFSVADTSAQDQIEAEKNG